MKSEIYSQSKYILYVGLKNFAVVAGQTYFWLDTTCFWWDSNYYVLVKSNKSSIIISSGRRTLVACLWTPFISLEIDLGQNNNIEILLTRHGIERPLFQALYSSSKFFYVTASGEWQILQYCEASLPLRNSLSLWGTLRNPLFWRLHGIHYDTIFAIPHR